jgi:hypothetical protein
VVVEGIGIINKKERKKKLKGKRINIFLLNCCIVTILMIESKIK